MNAAIVKRYESENKNWSDEQWARYLQIPDDELLYRIYSGKTYICWNDQIAKFFENNLIYWYGKWKLTDTGIGYLKQVWTT